LDFTPGAESIRVQRQWSPKERRIKDPKDESAGTIAMVAPLRDRLLALPRESEWVFTTLRGHHYVPPTRDHHWNRARCSVGLGTTALYEATRQYFAWYLLNVAELPDYVVAAQLRHDDGGTLVRELYGHPDAAIAANASGPRSAPWRRSWRCRLPTTPGGRHDRLPTGESGSVPLEEAALVVARFGLVVRVVGIGGPLPAFPSPGTTFLAVMATFAHARAPAGLLLLRLGALGH